MSSQSRVVYLYHVSPAVNAESILEHGLLVKRARPRPAVYQPPRCGVWFVSASRLAWAVQHTCARHRVHQVAIFRVGVPRAWLRPYRARLGRGVWYVLRDVPPVRLACFGVGLYDVACQSETWIADRELRFTGGLRFVDRPVAVSKLGVLNGV